MSKGEHVEVRLAGGKVFTRPVAKAGEVNTAIWQCGPCAGGGGTCCSRTAESLPPTARKVIARGEAASREAYLRAQLQLVKKGEIQA